MKSDVIFFAWNRAIPAREHLSGKHFEEFNHYLTELQNAAKIESYEVVFLNHHGGDLNGFFLIKGDAAQLDEILASEQWRNHMIRASFHLEGAGEVRGVTGDLVLERMRIWANNIPT